MMEEEGLIVDVVPTAIYTSNGNNLIVCVGSVLFYLYHFILN